MNPSIHIMLLGLYVRVEYSDTEDGIEIIRITLDEGTELDIYGYEIIVNDVVDRINRAIDRENSEV